MFLSWDCRFHFLLSRLFLRFHQFCDLLTRERTKKLDLHAYKIIAYLHLFTLYLKTISCSHHIRQRSEQLVAPTPHIFAGCATSLLLFCRLGDGQGSQSSGLSRISPGEVRGCRME
ncbi:hypothetical protein DL98DRAFT_170158 [Cadophora sp. DSE1049]|nr:hypothetical protein DL98DRAFT_170158 [Cadophora sp. DSE1049]